MQVSYSCRKENGKGWFFGVSMKDGKHTCYLPCVIGMAGVGKIFLELQDRPFSDGWYITEPEELVANNHRTRSTARSYCAKSNTSERHRISDQCHPMAQWRWGEVDWKICCEHGSWEVTMIANVKIYVSARLLVQLDLSYAAAAARTSEVAMLLIQYVVSVVGFQSLSRER